ncbi:MAG: acylphosphatase [Bacteroidota bacterium]
MRSAIKILVRTDCHRSGYRYYALKKGRDLGIVGTISNEGDSGCITIHAEAKDWTLQQYVNILRAGTPFCRVTGITIIPKRLLHCIYFEIIPTGNYACVNYTRKSKVRIFHIGFFGL